MVCVPVLQDAGLESLDVRAIRSCQHEDKRHTHDMYVCMVFARVFEVTVLVAAEVFVPSGAAECARIRARGGERGGRLSGSLAQQGAFSAALCCQLPSSK